MREGKVDDMEQIMGIGVRDMKNDQQITNMLHCMNDESHERVDSEYRE